VLVLLALASAAAQAADPPHPDDPPPGFLEFLGSVDRLAEVNPDYLSQADAARARPAGSRPASPPAAPPAAPAPAPPPSPPQPPSASISGPGGQNSE
jgi:hypothetical protein